MPHNITQVFVLQIDEYDLDAGIKTVKLNIITICLNSSFRCGLWGRSVADVVLVVESTFRVAGLRELHQLGQWWQD